MKEEEFLSTWLYKLKYRDIFWAWGKRKQLGGLFQQGDSKELKTAKIKGSCKKKKLFEQLVMQNIIQEILLTKS